jgi:hypothetical protein
MKPKTRSHPKARSPKNSCKSCKLPHGKHGIVCSAHPYGPELSDCPDHEPVSRWVYVWRTSENVRLFFRGGCLTLGLLSSSSILLVSSSWMFFSLVSQNQMPTPDLFNKLVAITAFRLGIVVLSCSIVLILFVLLSAMRNTRGFHNVNFFKPFILAVSFVSASLFWIFALKFLNL